MTTLGAYSFDGAGDDVADFSGNGNDFSITGTDTIKVAGHTNEGITKNGSNRPVLPMMGQTDNRTVMMWAKGQDTVWYIRWVTADDTGLWGILVLGGNIGVRARNAGSVANPGVPVPTDGEWHHYAGTYDGTTVRFYLDGTLVASEALAGPLRTDATVIDMMEWSGNTTTIDDVRILDETLTEAQITALKDIPVGEEEDPDPPDPPDGGDLLTTSDTVRANMLTALTLSEPQLDTNVDLMNKIQVGGGFALVTVVPEWTPAKQLLEYWISVRGY